MVSPRSKKNLKIVGAGTEDPRNIIGSEDLPDGVEKWGDEEKFRVDAKRFFLTYPKCWLSKEELQKEIFGRVGESNIQSLEICLEYHKDGTPHLHAILVLKRKYNCRDCRWLDFGTYHPNIGGVKRMIAARNYIRKMDLQILSFGNDDPFEGPEGFCRKKQDWDAWNIYNEDKKLKVWEGEFNILGFTGGNINTKKRHLWIVGDSDMGKTTMIEDTFEGYKVYKPQKDSEYKFDDYNGEAIIIYDDYFPKIAEIEDVSNIYKTKTPVYGKTRYTRKYWPMKQARTMIVITNDIPSYAEMDAFKNRFNLFDVRSSRQARGSGDGRKDLREAVGIFIAGA